MAQIIKHRRGTLAELGGITLANGEIGIVTGSAVIGDAALRTAVVVGNTDGTHRLSIGRIITGNATPNLTSHTGGAAFNNMLYHETDAKTLLVLNTGGNTNLDLIKNWKAEEVLNAYKEAPKKGLRTLLHNKSFLYWGKIFLKLSEEGLRKRSIKNKNGKGWMEIRTLPWRGEGAGGDVDSDTPVSPDVCVYKTSVDPDDGLNTYEYDDWTCKCLSSAGDDKKGTWDGTDASTPGYHDVGQDENMLMERVHLLVCRGQNDKKGAPK